MINRNLILIGLLLATFGVVGGFYPVTASDDCNLKRHYDTVMCCQANVECPLCTGSTLYSGTYTKFSGATITRIGSGTGNEKIVSSTGVTCWQDGTCRAGTGGFGNCCEKVQGCVDSAWGQLPCAAWCYLTRVTLHPAHPETSYSMTTCGGG